MFLYRCFSIVTWTFYSFSHLSQFHRFGLDCHHTISPDILTTFILFNFIFWQCFFVDASRLLLEILTHFHISHNFIDFLCAFSCGFPKLYGLYIGAHTSSNNQGNTESQRKHMFFKWIMFSSFKSVLFSIPSAVLAMNKLWNGVHK